MKLSFITSYNFMFTLDKFFTLNQKVAGSIPDDVMEFFIDINPSDGTQPLTEMSTRSISWA
jgi:hypothetical protein